MIFIFRYLSYGERPERALDITECQGYHDYVGIQKNDRELGFTLALEEIAFRELQ